MSSPFAVKVQSAPFAKLPSPAWQRNSVQENNHNDKNFSVCSVYIGTRPLYIVLVGGYDAPSRCSEGRLFCQCEYQRSAGWNGSHR